VALAENVQEQPMTTPERVRKKEKAALQWILHTSQSKH